MHLKVVCNVWFAQLKIDDDDDGGDNNDVEVPHCTMAQAMKLRKSRFSKSAQK